ncbi:MAG: hypothetical protein ACKODH_15785 [Limisphaerales bacterium]
MDAIAVCKHCGRVLCATCATDVGLAVACKDRCEAEVASILDMHQRGKTAYDKAAASHSKNGVFIGLMGLVFTVLGCFGWGKGGGFMLWMGLLFLISSAFSFHSAKKYRSRD